MNINEELIKLYVELVDILKRIRYRKKSKLYLNDEIDRLIGE